MKRLIGYTLCIVGLCAFFTTCYYISFKHALNQFNKNAVERDSKILESFEEYQKQARLLYMDETVYVDSSKEDVIGPNTTYYFEIYNVNTNELTREELNPTSDLIGLKRSDVIEKLANYMENLPISERNKGLYAYDLLQFSSKEITIRKSYNEDLVAFRFYVVVEDGKVIVYYSDKKTVREYTEIQVTDLEEKERNDLMNGIYIKTEEELYSLLESYSS